MKLMSLSIALTAAMLLCAINAETSAREKSVIAKNAADQNAVKAIPANTTIASLEAAIANSIVVGAVVEEEAANIASAAAKTNNAAGAIRNAKTIAAMTASPGVHGATPKVRAVLLS